MRALGVHCASTVALLHTPCTAQFGASIMAIIATLLNVVNKVPRPRSRRTVCCWALHVRAASPCACSQFEREVSHSFCMAQVRLLLLVAARAVCVTMQYVLECVRPRRCTCTHLSAACTTSSPLSAALVPAQTLLVNYFVLFAVTWVQSLRP